jgi:hypothetical protein
MAFQAGWKYGPIVFVWTGQDCRRNKTEDNCKSDISCHVGVPGIRPNMLLIRIKRKQWAGKAYFSLWPRFTCHIIFYKYDNGSKKPCIPLGAGHAFSFLYLLRSSAWSIQWTMPAAFERHSGKWNIIHSWEGSISPLLSTDDLLMLYF